MPNIASVLKAEIIRLAKRETRVEIEALKKSVAKHRSEMADLKRRIGGLEKLTARAAKSQSKAIEGNPQAEGTVRYRFSARRLVTQRKKLNLSAAEMGTLVGVSAQTIYNWEAGKSRPRQQQMASLAAVRGMGKRQIKERLSSE